MKRFLAVCLALLVLPAPAAARPGDLDETFSRDGIADPGVDSIFRVAVDPQGRVLVLALPRGEPAPLVRLLADGELDPAFGSGGRVEFAAGGYDYFELEALPDGRIMLAGRGGAGGTDGYYVATRLLSDGSPDQSFGNEGTAIVDFPRFEYLTGMAVMPDGGVLLAGSGDNGDGQTALKLARLTAGGAPDPAFSGDGTQSIVPPGDRVYGPGPAVVAADGSGYVAYGTDFLAGGRAHVLKLRADGEVDAVYGDAGVATAAGRPPQAVYEIAFDSAGRIVFGGTPCAGLHIYCSGVLGRFSVDGQPDTSFGEGGVLTSDGGVASVIPMPDSRLFVAGFERSRQPTRDDVAIRLLDGAGVPDPAFGDGGAAITDVAFGHDRASGAALTPDGRLVVATGSAVLRYELGPGTADADADLHPDAADTCPKRFADHRSGCPRFERELVVKNGLPRNIAGRIEYEPGTPSECAGDQPVRLMLKRRGPDRRLATDRTSRYGHWDFPPTDATRLYVVAPRTIEPGLGRCTPERARVPGTR